MPELSVTEEQYDRLEEVRQAMEEAFVDSYGHIRLTDVLEYLLDTHRPPEREEQRGSYELIATAEYPDLQRVASDVSGVPGSGIDADEMRGKLLVELGPEEFARKLRAGEDDGTDSPSDGVDSPSDGETEEDAPDSPGGADSGNDGGLLSAANRLLDEHEDKWRESAGDAPYEVDLPDGSTEAARTRDDVRQLLFRHY